VSVVVKISKETHEDLYTIQEAIIKHGTKVLPPEFHPMLESMKTKQITYKAIIGLSVGFLRTVLYKIKD